MGRAINRLIPYPIEPVQCVNKPIDEENRRSDLERNSVNVDRADVDFVVQVSEPEVGCRLAFVEAYGR